MKVGCDGSPAQVSCPGCTLWKTAIIPSLDVIFPPVTLYTFYSLATVFFSTSLIFRRVLCLLIWLKYFTHLFFFYFCHQLFSFPDSSGHLYLTDFASMKYNLFFCMSTFPTSPSPLYLTDFVFMKYNLLFWLSTFPRP